MQRRLVPLLHHKLRTVWLKGHLVKESRQGVGVTERAAVRDQQKKQSSRSIAVESYS